jgi:hypothetical protein
MLCDKNESRVVGSTGTNGWRKSEDTRLQFNVVVFQARSRSRQLLSSCPSVCQRVSARLPLDRFPWNLVLGTYLLTYCMEQSPSWEANQWS